MDPVKAALELTVTRLCDRPKKCGHGCVEKTELEIMQHN